MHLSRRKKALRLATLLTGGGVLVAITTMLRPYILDIPAPAPLSVQQEGQSRIDRILLVVSKTSFGVSERGRKLRDAIDQLRTSGAVIFTADIGAQAKHFEWRIGQDVLYVRVLRGASGKYTHQSDEGIAQGIYHEAVHALWLGDSGSVEEECDGFAAGFAAGSAFLGESLPSPLLMDGKPIAQFVRSAYPAFGRDLDYKPVGQSREWLLNITGLE
jgi:hypothetical protein